MTRFDLQVRLKKYSKEGFLDYFGPLVSFGLTEKIVTWTKKTSNSNTSGNPVEM